MSYINQLPILNNIIDLFKINNLLSHKEKDDVELSMGSLIDNFITGDPLGYSNVNFEYNLKEYVFNSIFLLLKNVYDNEELLKLELESIFERIIQLYFKKYYPPRSYETTFVRNTNIDKHRLKELIANKIVNIENKPQPEQRTEDWYKFRHNLITASSGWKVFKSQSTINQLIVEKCKELDVSKYDSINTNTPMHHGNKYEDVSIMLYESIYKTKVKDYGCIQHEKYKFIGASPDGIVIDSNSPRYGRMLEIKNPTTRELTGIPKEDYWIQMQLQMETCNLNECDFLETVFKEYDSKEEFMEDGTFTYTKKDELKGVIIYFIKEGKPLYEYMPLYMTEAEFVIWEEDIMDKYTNLTWIKNIYWRMEDYSCVLVLRNKIWFQYAVSKIENVWKMIEDARENGYEQRLPKKQNRGSRSNSITDTTEQIENKCLINVDNLKNQIIYIDTKYELDPKFEIDIKNKIDISDISDNLIL